MNKFQKLIKSIQYIIKQPSLVNLILDQNDVRKLEFQKQYPQLLSLPEVSLDEITNGNFESNVDLFILDGGSLPTDLALLKTLAKGKSSYFEIGTWRGESIWNIAKEIDEQWVGTKNMRNYMVFYQRKIQKSCIWKAIQKPLILPDLVKNMI